jgi:hypothetical protein
MEDTSRETQPAGRELSVRVYGDTADEIELAALDEVRPFFGDTVRLEVVRDYKAFTVVDSAFRDQAGGKKYYARVPVRTVEP